MCFRRFWIAAEVYMDLGSEKTLGKEAPQSQKRQGKPTERPEGGRVGPTQYRNAQRGQEQASDMPRTNTPGIRSRAGMARSGEP